MARLFGLNIACKNVNDVTNVEYTTVWVNSTISIFAEQSTVAQYSAHIKQTAANTQNSIISYMCGYVTKGHNMSRLISIYCHDKRA